MKIFEIIAKHEIVDLDAINAQSLKEYLLDNPNLYENDADYIDARRFLDLHKTQVPKVGNSYVYAGINVIPYVKFIQINYFKELQELKKLDNNYAFFQIENKIKGFPENSSLKSDALSQIYFFNSKDEYDKFIMLLELKFSDYKISYKSLDQITTENFATGKEMYARLARSGAPLDVTSRGLTARHQPRLSMKDALCHARVRPHGYTRLKGHADPRAP